MCAPVVSSGSSSESSDLVPASANSGRKDTVPRSASEAVGSSGFRMVQTSRALMPEVAACTATRAMVGGPEVQPKESRRDKANSLAAVGRYATDFEECGIAGIVIVR